jgi:hypothetical protein
MHIVTRDVSCCTVLMKTEKGYEVSEVFKETVSINACKYNSVNLWPHK